jgi:hypothetical protein
MMRTLMISGLICLGVSFADAQGFSAFPDDQPKRWGGLGVGYPDISLSVNLTPHFFPLFFRPQLDFGIFQRHGHAIRGGKGSIGYVSPLSVLGMGNTIVGAVAGYNTDRLSSRKLPDGSALIEEEEIFLWGGFMGEMVEVSENVFLTLEVRFLNQEVTARAVDPVNFYEEHTGKRYRTTWMIGVHVLLW